jgi:RNA polymerase sigma-32 factor
LSDFEKDQDSGSTHLPALSPSRGISGSQDLLARYMSEIRRYPLLNAEEEQGLTLQYQESHDSQVAYRLITANLRLVVKIAFEYRRSWTNLLDLIQEGNMGLAQALEKFDPLRGIRFTSYAQYWIRAYILQYIMNNVSLVRIGSTRSGRKLFYQLQKERNKLIAQGITPGPRLLAERLDVPQEEIEWVSARISSRDISLDQPTGNDQEGRPVAELISADDSYNPEEEVASNEAGNQLKSALEAFGETLLDQREKAIWQDRLLNDSPVSLAELGERFGVSKERIRQLEERLKSRARTYLRDALGDDVSLHL